MKVQSPINFSWKKAWKEFAPAFVVVVNTLVWYIISYVILNSITGESAPELQGLFFLVYYVAIAFSAIIGAYILPRAERLGLAFWMLFGALVSSSMIFIQSSNELVTLLILVLLGVSVGSGLPSALTYFANRTAIVKRGLFGGIIWSAIGFIILLLLVVVGTFGVTFGLLTLVAWRLSGFVLFALLDRKQVVLSSHATPSYHNILKRRDVLLYLLPWLMFSIVNFIETPLLANIMGQELTTTLGLIEFVILGIFAIIGGFIADAFGRKRVVITGFVLLGINYALLSVFYGNPISWYVYTFLDGVTWGMFAVVFFMAVWGDLAMDSRKEKYYVLGGLPYLLSGLLPILVQPYILSVQPTMAFSLASFFLFIAVLPLIYAPETLPEKHVKERDLKNYIEKAKRMVEKSKKNK